PSAGPGPDRCAPPSARASTHVPCRSPPAPRRRPPAPSWRVRPRTRRCPDGCRSPGQSLSVSPWMGLIPLYVLVPTGDTVEPAAGQRHRSPAEWRWVPPGLDTRIAGHDIADGLLYVGRPLPSRTGGIEPALINPDLPVAAGPLPPGGRL